MSQRITKSIVFLSFSLLSLFCVANIPPVPYMDQVINRKKQQIAQKCSQPTGTKGFMMVEVQVEPTGKAKARLLATDISQKAFLSCALSLLTRTKFRVFSQKTVSRIYRFFIL